ncbi:MAG: hypothetical protein ACWGQW_01400 [bacterium]
MSTGAEFANFVFKRLTAAEDFSTRFLDFLLSNFRELSVRVFATQGVFDAKITIGGSANPNEVVLAQGAPGDFRGTDQLGNILGLGASGSEDAGAGQVKAFQIENTLAQTYHLSMQYTEVPRGIQINPRNGIPQYTKIVQAVGVKAAPNAVVDNGGSLTFTIDSVCESGHSHAGRTAIVYKVAPVRGAITEALAIETCVVSWNGLNNKITTVAVFGQDTVSTTPADYLVVLLGPSVRKVDTSGTAGHTYLGTIVGTGSGSILGAGDNSNQNLIDQSLSSLTLYPGGPAWADGTTNPATTIVSQITKIITDLTSTTGNRGMGKITMKAGSPWHDGVTNPAARADIFVAKIISDLAAEWGGSGADKIGAKSLPTTWADATIIAAGSIHDQLDGILAALTSNSGVQGLGKITAAARAVWADAVTNPATDADSALKKIITDLTSTTGQRGAGKLTAPARSNWYDSSTNPAARVDEALEKIITDLTTTSGNRGAGKISAWIDVSWHDGNTFTAGSVATQLVAIVEKLTIDGKGSDRIDAEALSSALVGPTPAGFFEVAAGSIKDQLLELVQEQATARQVAAYGARNYAVRESVIASSTYAIRDFTARYTAGSPYNYYAIGDNNAGVVTGLRYTTGHVGVTWQSGPAYAGSPTYTRQITHGSDVSQVAVIGDDAAGAWIEYTPDSMAGAFAASSMSSPTAASGRAIHYHNDSSNWIAGYYQLVAGVGFPIQKATNPASGFVPTGITRPTTLRGVYCFADNGSDGDLIGGGIDSSGNAMIVRSADGGSLWSDVTPSSPPSQPVTDMVWDEYRQRFWAILANGDLWYSDSTGTTWTKKTNGLYTLYSRLAVDPYTGVMIFSNGGNDRLAVSSDPNVEYCDEIGAGEEIHWESLGVCHWFRGRFLVAAENDLLVGGTLRGGDRTSLFIGSE